MKITGLEFSKTWNVAQYESETLKVHVVIQEEGADPQKCVKSIIKFVTDRGESPLSDDVGASQHVTTNVTTKINDKTAAEVKPKKSKAVKEQVAASEEVVVEEESKNSEEAESASGSSEQASDMAGATGEKSSNDAETKEVKSSPKSKIKHTVYDREVKSHRTLMGETLDKVLPNWRDPKIKPTALVVSEKMAGENFLDSEGQVLKEFIDSLKFELKKQGQKV